MMMALYRVKDWNTHFENNRTRELKRLDWVPVPNKMDGRGYTALVDHPNGAAHLGGWIAILEIASRQKVRGEIPQDGAGLSQCLARISRLPAILFEELIPRLESMGWVEGAEIPQLGATIPQDGAASRARIPFPSVQFSSLPSDFEERFSAAWDRHKKHRGEVTRQMVAQRLLDVDWDAWDARHVPFCEFWDRAGWTVCTLGMLQWYENGMPLPPPEAIDRKPAKSKTTSSLDEYFKSGDNAQ